jgi:predicted dehydrogenase
MRLGKHVYCEKPLTHNVYETRVLTDLAAEHKLATQLGTQIHAGGNYRRVVELVQSGAIGPVGEVHVWLGGNFKHQGPWPANTSGSRPADTPPVPKGLDWDVWLGPAPERPYHPAYCPFKWRNWWTFANGRLGDFFCHFCDLAFWALKLKYPTTVEARGPAVNAEVTAPWTIARQEYPARGDLPPVVLNWHHGGPVPEIAIEKNVPQWGNAVLFVGRDGLLIADYSKHLLLPEDKYADFTRPEPTIPSSIGHHREWIEACKTGSPTTCNFAYSGPLTEAALLANVSLRAGKKLDWDAANLKAVGCPEAEPYLRREYRQGWTL